MKRALTPILILVILLSACTKRPSFEVKNFKPISESEQDLVALEMDLSEAVTKGIFIPARTESPFELSFDLSNHAEESQRFAYKLYYQNATYKWEELNEEGNYDPISQKNFYGSWEEAAEGFRLSEAITPGSTITINSTFRIQGNPRDEQLYFGPKAQDLSVTREKFESAKKNISGNPEWMEQIRKKAGLNNIPVEEQLARDARWMLEHGNQSKEENHRWKRNPRVGEYEFMLVVIPEQDLGKVPEHIAQIHKKDTTINAYYNPFAWYEIAAPEEAVIAKSSQRLLAKAVLSGQKGVYVDPYKLKKDDPEAILQVLDEVVGEEVQEHALFEQYFHHIDKNFSLNNIPYYADVTGDNLTRAQYDSLAAVYPDSMRIVKHVSNATEALRTVGYSSDEDAIYLINPGKDSVADFTKQHAGIASRVGFNYGKFTAWIAFPEMMSDDGVWNGLTCAFWLLNQPGNDWNKRSECGASGYIDKMQIAETEERIRETSYTEIDIEIVKTGKHWPKSSYGGVEDYPTDDPRNNNNLIVACTNWDLACDDMSNFIIGAKNYDYQGLTLEHHRWDWYYKALSSKYENPHDETVGRKMCYQIDWSPTEIIWRIGPDKENLKVIGYMDSTFTKIPDNQMQTMVTQEWHDASWWPMAPYSQDNVPFPLNDIKGYVYKVEVE